jgi:NADPH:quinone reductase-like Zn-dependent oxidoreductase
MTTSIPTTQKALEVAKFGDPLQGALRLNTSASVPKPGPGQVLIQMLYACLNPADVFVVQGQYPGVAAVREGRTGFVGGLEGVGRVVAQGPATSLPVGTRVVPALADRSGCWQQFVAVDENLCIKVPEGVDDKVAAQLIVNPVTVVGMLERIEAEAPVHGNPWIAQTAANSTLGRMFIQMAKKRGFCTVNVVRSKASVAELKQLGADEVIVFSEEPNFAQRIEAITNGRGLAAVVDAVAGDMGSAALAALAPGGLFLGYGMQSGEPTRVLNSDLIFKGIVVRGFWLATWLKKQKETILADVFEMLRTGEMQPHVQQVFPLDQYEEAFRAQFAPDRKGKILFRLN